MRYGSVCSGIEAATIAWHPLGWKPVWFSEIEPFPCRLLAHYYPSVPNLGDMLKLHEKEIYQQSVIDLLVGGTPCQSFSTAGLRAGLDSPNGNLALEFCRILTTKRPRWFVWENVPGVFSSGKGEDFRSILRGFSQCGYSCAWRVLDAQFFGVPQRRRRVFVVGYLGNDWRPPAAVLFEPEGMRRDTTKGGEKGKAVAALTKTGVGTCGADDNQAQGGRLIAGTIDASYGRLQGASGQDGGHGHSTLVSSLTARCYADNESNESKLIIANTLRGGGHDSSDDGTRQNLVVESGGHWTMSTGQASAEILENQAPTLNCNHEQPIMWSIMPMNSSNDYKAREVKVTQPITTNQGISNNGGDIIQERSIVRRLTPLECERLQGFPDGYTAIPGAADSPRYEAIGNSMAVPVMAWIGRRIDQVDKQLKS